MSNATTRGWGDERQPLHALTPPVLQAGPGINSKLTGLVRVQRAVLALQHQLQQPALEAVRPGWRGWKKREVAVNGVPSSASQLSELCRMQQPVSKRPPTAPCQGAGVPDSRVSLEAP